MHVLHDSCCFSGGWEGQARFLPRLRALARAATPVRRTSAVHPRSHPSACPAQGHKVPQGWKSTHKFVGAFMRDLQRAEDTPPLALGSAKTVRDLKKRAENIVSKVRRRHSSALPNLSLDPRRLQDCALAVHSQHRT